MRSVSAFAAAFLLCSACAHMGLAPQDANAGFLAACKDSVPGSFKPDVLIVSCESAESKQMVLDKASEIGAELVYDYQNFNMVAIRKPQGATLAETVDLFKGINGVLNVVEDQMCQLDANDYSTAM